MDAVYALQSACGSRPASHEADVRMMFRMRPFRFQIPPESTLTTQTLLPRNVNRKPRIYPESLQPARCAVCPYPGVSQLAAMIVTPV